MCNREYKMQDIVTKEGFNYGFDATACATCGGRCCVGESGYIYVNTHEMERIANFLEIDIEELKSRYLYKVGYKYSIKEQQNGSSHECIFYENGCTIYAARPLQCRTFPFWDYYKTRVDELKQECPGIVDV